MDPASCTTPGYQFRYTGQEESFTGWQGTTPQDGWTSVDNNGTGQLWEYSNPKGRTPPLGGDADFAIMDYSSFAKVENSTLTSPVIDLSGQAAPEIGFDSSFTQGIAGATLVGLSLDGGKTWTNIWKQTLSSAGQVSIPVLQAAGQADVRVRFTFTARSSAWWAIDNVYAGTRTCVPVAGGLVEGVVRDRATGKPVVGATVASTVSPADTTVSVATPDDPRLPDGFYALFSSHTGSTGLTASAAGYTTGQASVHVFPGRIASRDWWLTAAG